MRMKMNAEDETTNTVDVLIQLEAQRGEPQVTGPVVLIGGSRHGNYRG